MVKKLSEQQIRILEFCKDTPRYTWEIQMFMEGDNKFHGSCMGSVWGLAKRGFLYPCSTPDKVDGCQFESYIKRRKYYISDGFDWIKNH